MTNHIKDALTAVLKINNDWRLDLLSSWDTILGPLSDKVRLEKIKDNTLILGVYDSAWLQELYLLSPMLLTKINSHLKQPHVHDLRFKAAAKHKTPHKTEYKGKQVSSKQRTLTSKEHAALEKISDEQLRSVLQEFLIRCYQESE